MANLLSQFGVGVNPFTTPVGQRIEQATDGSLASENWALNMEICDAINETDEGPKDAVRAIRKRLLQNAGKNYTIVMYTLTVLETCVKNCGKRFQLLVTQKDFVQDLVKLIGPKNDPPTVVQEKVLSLIQSWAEAFRKNPEMQGVVQVYTDLKQKGIEFPSSDVETMAPIHTPVRTVPVPSIPQEDTNPHAAVLMETPPAPFPVGIHPQQMEKLKSEIEVVQGNTRVFNEMLTELEPGTAHQSDLELLHDLCKTCQHMQTRIVELIDKVGNETITEDLLVLNDELNNLFVRYERFEKKRVAVGKAGTQEKEVHAESKPLIDLEDSATFISQDLKAISISSDVRGGDAPSSGVDEFDMFAQSRKSEQVSNQDLLGGQMTGALDSTVTPEFHREQDIDEIARWLEDKPDDSAEAAGPNTGEFDRFLQTRAAAAERLPTVAPAAATAESNVKKENEPLSLLKS